MVVGIYIGLDLLTLAFSTIRIIRVEKTLHSGWTVHRRLLAWHTPFIWMQRIFRAVPSSGFVLAAHRSDQPQEEGAYDNEPAHEKRRVSQGQGSTLFNKVNRC